MNSTTYTLSKIDIAALRKADRLLVHFDGGFPAKSRFTAYRDLTDKEREADPYADGDKAFSIAMPEGSIRCGGYGFNGSLSSYLTADQQRFVKAFGHVSLYRSQATEESTIIDSLRVGDEIWLEFVAGCSSEMMTKHGIDCDELRLHVTRGGKRLQYLLRYEVSEIHSTARMIRGLPAKAERSVAA